MVTLTAINDENDQKLFDEQVAAAAAADAADQDYSDVGSDDEDDVEEDEDDDFDIDETIYERVIALKDIVPPQHRVFASKAASSVYDWASAGLSFSGKAIYIVTSSALLLGVPLALSIMSEQQLNEMEAEMKLSQGSNDIVAPGAASALAAPPATA
ncbi:Mitochondrial import receptor subunit TOM22 [Yarrowia sp. C11]|nr:Mitochondrial import receptor subunit TOM22 [Yarrowia sp. E02]KAG5373136.1 Mitochondrial import receptor subunit TOM22 [Yarrowia sp. C11]